MKNEIEKQENAVATPQITPMTLIHAAQEKEVSIEKMEQLFELQMKWEANDARKMYNDAFAKFKSEQINIIKDAVVDFTFKDKRTFYRHSSLAHIVDLVVPVMSKYGLSHTWETDQGDGRIRVTCRVRHKSGHSEGVSLYSSADNSSGKNNIQAVGSTVTYLQRYTLMSILGLASGDVDTDGTEPERNPDDYLSENQICEMTALIDEVRGGTPLETYIEQFVAWAGYGCIEDIPRVKYSNLTAKLEKKRGA